MNKFYKSLPVFCFIVISGFSSAQFPFTEDFETGGLSAGLWNVSGNAQVSTVNPNAGIYCLEGPGTWGINRTFTAANVSWMTCEFSARSSQTNTVSMIFRIKDQPGGTSCGLLFDDNGYITCTDSSGPTSAVPIMTYAIDKWYHFIFEMDYINKTYDLYVNNALVADDYTFFSQHFTVPWLFTWSSVATSGTAWVDDINIFYGIAADINEVNVEKPYAFFQNGSGVSIHSSESIDELRLYNANGSMIRSKKDFRGSMRIDMDDLPKGVYFLNIIVKGRSYSDRFLFMPTGN